MHNGVMAGLAPVTHALVWGTRKADVGARARPGHDTVATGHDTVGTGRGSPGWRCAVHEYGVI